LNRISPVQYSPRRQSAVGASRGSTENAGPEIRRTKPQGWKMQDLENDGPKSNAQKAT